MMGLGINNARRTFWVRVSGLVSLDSPVIFYSIIPIIAFPPSSCYLSYHHVYNHHFPLAHFLIDGEMPTENLLAKEKEESHCRGIRMKRRIIEEREYGLNVLVW